MLKKCLFVLIITVLAVSCVNVESDGDTGTTGTTGTTGVPGDTDDPYFPGDNATITITGVSSSTVSLSWAHADDTNCQWTLLEYLVCFSKNELDLNSETSAAGHAFGTWETNITSKTVTGLDDGTTYYFTVLVRDTAHNDSKYLTTHTNTTELGTIYWTQGDLMNGDPKSSFVSANLAGETQIRRTETSHTLGRLAYSAADLIYVAYNPFMGGDGYIKSLTSLGAPTTKLSLTNAVTAIAIDTNNNLLYRAEYVNDATAYGLIFRSDLNGGSETIIYSNTNTIIKDLSVNEFGYLFLLATGDSGMGCSIHMTTSSGSSLVEIIQYGSMSGEMIQGMTVNGVNVYYSLYGISSRTIEIILTNGAQVDSITTTADYDVLGISVFNGKIYWSECYSTGPGGPYTALIRRADDLTFNNPTTIVSGITNWINDLLVVP